MTPSLDRLTVSRTAVVVGLGYLAVAILLASLPVRSVPNLHAVLDTSSMLLCGLLAWLLWDMGARLENRLPRWLAATFALTAIGELVHVLVTVEWTGALAPVAGLSGVLRPTTWLTASYLLPIGIAVSAWRRPRLGASLGAFVVTLLAILAVLVTVAFVAPPYAPWFLGVTRPVLLGVPIAFLIAGATSSYRWTEDRLLPSVALTGPAAGDRAPLHPLFRNPARHDLDGHTRRQNRRVLHPARVLVADRLLGHARAGPHRAFLG